MKATISAIRDRDVTKTIYTFGVLLLLIVVLVGSPLASFGCQTIVPDQFQVPCETTPGETAVQSNFIQPILAALTIIVLQMVICRLHPQHLAPQEVFLVPLLPPPRLFASVNRE